MICEEKAYAIIEGWGIEKEAISHLTHMHYS